MDGLTVQEWALVASFLFAPGNMLSAYLTGHARISGWLVLMAVQAGMAVFGVVTGYWGFLGNLGMFAVAVYQYRRWRAGARRAPDQGASPVVGKSVVRQEIATETT